MNKTIKTAVSVPTEIFRKAEALRRKEKKSRSAFYAQALQSLVKADEIREMDARYEEGYRKFPETPKEIAEIEATARASAEAFEKEHGDW